MYNAWRDDHRRRCSYCDALGEYLTRYDYVTGKGGRVSDARHLVCRDHAEQFAAKHKLQMPTKEQAT